MFSSISPRAFGVCLKRHLGFVHSTVRSAFGHELAVSSALRYRTVLAHIDAVGFDAVVQSVGDHEDCLRLRYLPYDAHNEFFTLRVDIAGGLIEDHDLRIDQEGSGKSYALSLTSGYIGAFLLKLHGKTAPLSHERNEVDGVESLIELFICRVGFSHSQVVGH